jgi:hypothetical protein
MTRMTRTRATELETLRSHRKQTRWGLGKSITLGVMAGCLLGGICVRGWNVYDETATIWRVELALICATVIYLCITQSRDLLNENRELTTEILRMRAESPAEPGSLSMSDLEGGSLTLTSQEKSRSTGTFVRTGTQGDVR